MEYSKFINPEEPKIDAEIKKEVERMYDLYFKKTARSNVLTWLQNFKWKHHIKEDLENIKAFIRFYRIGIPDYIFWKYQGDTIFDDSLNNDDE